MFDSDLALNLRFGNSVLLVVIVVELAIGGKGLFRLKMIVLGRDVSAILRFGNSLVLEAKELHRVPHGSLLSEKYKKLCNFNPKENLQRYFL